MTDTTSTPIAKTVASLPGSAAERFAANIAARHREGDRWKEISYAEAGQEIEELALGLLELGIEPGDMTLGELRERGSGGDRTELTGRQDKVERDDAWIIIYTSGTTGPPKGVVLTHANAMQVCHIVEELEFVKPDETTYLYLPLAHIFALLTQLASYDQGTTIVYFGGDSKKILEEVVETRPTYLPSVPRIFEKLYGAATKMQKNASEEDKQRFQGAIKLGVEVRRRQQRGDPVPEEM